LLDGTAKALMLSGTPTRTAPVYDPFHGTRANQNIGIDPRYTLGNGQPPDSLPDDLV
jgi:hypothetical protein